MLLANNNHEYNCTVFSARYTYEHFEVVTSTHVNTYYIEEEETPILKYSKKLSNSAIIGTTYHQGELVLVTGENKLNYYLSDIRLNLKLPWILYDNIVYRLINDNFDTSIVYKIPKENYIYHMDLHKDNLEIYSVDLFGPPILNYRKYQLNKHNDSKKLIKSIDIHLKESIACITTSNEWIVLGGRSLTVIYKSNYDKIITHISYDYDYTPLPTIKAVKVYENGIVYTKSNHQIALVYIINGKVAHEYIAPTSTIYTKIEFGCDNYLVTYGEYHYPLFWNISGGKLYCVSPINRSLLSCYTGNLGSNSKLLTLTDGCSSQILKNKDFYIEEILGDEKVDFIGLMKNKMILSHTENNRYEISCFKSKVENNTSYYQEKTGYKVERRKLKLIRRFTFPEEILDINSEYLVTKDKIHRYKFKNSKMEIGRSYDYELYQFSGPLLVIYNNSLISYYGSHGFGEMKVDFIHNESASLTLSVSFEGKYNYHEISIGNLVKMYEFSYDITTRKFTNAKFETFQTIDDKIVIMDGIPSKGIYISENFEIFKDFKPYKYNIPYKFIKIFSFANFTFIGLTIDHEIIVVYENYCHNLSLEFNFGKVLNVMNEYTVFQQEIFVIQTEYNLFRYSYDEKCNQKFISESIPDVITNYIDFPVTPIAIGTNSIHQFNIISGKIKSFYFDDKNVIQYVKFLEFDMICLIVISELSGYSIEWFSSKTDSLDKVDSPPLESFTGMVIMENPPRIAHDRIIWYISLSDNGIINYATTRFAKLTSSLIH